MNYHPPEIAMRIPIIVPTLLCLAAGTAQAVEFAGVEFHGFFSQGYVSSSDNAWLVDDSADGSWDLNEAGINVSYNATDRLRFAGQIYASDMWGSTQTINSGSFDQHKAAKVNLDYLYGQYTFIDQFGIRAGRVKQAYGLYNEVRDIDAARSTAILPQSVYDNRDRESNFLVNGISGFGSVDLGPAGIFDWQAYWGTVNIPEDGTIAGQYQSADVTLNSIDVDAVVGGQLMWSTPLDGLRVGVSYRQTQGQHAEATISQGALGNLPSPPFPPGTPFPAVPFDVDIDTQDFWLFSGELLLEEWTIQAEYQRVKSLQKYQENLGGALGAGIQARLTPTPQETEGFYGLVSWRFIPQVEAGLIGSAYFQNWNDRMSENWNQYQIDYGVFARYDVTDWWTLKAEAHYVEGAGLLDKPDRDTGYFAGSVISTEYWTYFVARTTFSF
jgi:hypothetical protein